MLDFIRIACAVPDVTVANVAKNAEEICKYIAQADAQNVDLLVFPELSLTGATCADLFFEDALHAAVRKGMKQIVDCSKEHPNMTIVVGLPVRDGLRIFNSAAVIIEGEVQGFVPKSVIPASDESRWFASANDLCDGDAIGTALGWENEFCGGRAMFNIHDTHLCVEFGSDLASPVPVSGDMALNGAEITVCLAAAPEVVGTRTARRKLVEHQSDAFHMVYAYCSAGMMESTQDGVYSGHSMIAENGSILAENEKFTDSGYMIVTDCDLGRVRALRRRNSSFRDAARQDKDFWNVNWGVKDFRSDGKLYHLNKLPFIPETKAERDEYCREVFQIQVSGLKRRLKAIGCNPVLGISGGLDSTLALLVAVEAVRQLGRDASTVYGITLPCFGTSDRTYRNAWDLMKKLGITSKEISIKNAVTQHFLDIGHDPENRNTTYENGQARERTQILMDYSSTVNGIVVGTGDLSELALGWCTYNGDHMSMYGVNASIPKTLIRWLIDSIARMPEFEASRAVLEDILDTPISPELLPPDAQGKIAQYTEDLVGPYALHDFFLYYMVRYSFTPAKIFTLACRAFEGDFDAETIKKWLKSFYRRFFTQQFKRNCMPDGVKVGNISLCPRGDWRMPSDASGRIWLQEIETL